MILFYFLKKKKYNHEEKLHTSVHNDSQHQTSYCFAFYVIQHFIHSEQLQFENNHTKKKNYIHSDELNQIMMLFETL